MSDLIDREEVIDTLEKELSAKYNRIELAIGFIGVKSIIESVPSAEPKRGKWIRENIVLTSNPPQYRWHCSECGKMVHWFTTEVLTDFCPNCGAKMKK